MFELQIKRVCKLQIRSGGCVSLMCGIYDMLSLGITDNTSLHHSAIAFMHVIDVCDGLMIK